ncbi:hypothetical protein AVEN_65221-1 [Araneus ventricosus]|uniref:CCHC-type domain-containing protein n=1 Tax=Araneus ventricosus TaxID=182803 RepID=A0A4Y2AHF0_ARAVE|nr:hypothetical protein AVEN_65221-1 [Araneus ventricosus]
MYPIGKNRHKSFSLIIKILKTKLASHGQQYTPTCWPCVATPLTGGTFWSLVYQSAGIPAIWLVCSRGSSDSGQLLGLCVKGGRRSRKWPLAYRPWLAYKSSTEAGDAQSQQLPSLVGLHEFVSELEAQKVIAARRITLKRDGQIIPTRHVILTFDTPVLPTKITAGYICCDIRPYIPNPVRCFKCQRFGHTKTACRGSSALCPRCSEPGHEETICRKPEKCFNCKGNHASYSKTCPKWKLEKEILSVKVTKNISIQESRKIVHDRTPKTNYSYTAALTTIKNPDTPLGPIPTPTDPKPSTSATKNEETITVKLSDWLALLKVHKLSLEKEKTIDKKHEFLKPAPKNKRPKKDHANSKETNSNVKMKSKPNKTKSQDKESESDLQTSDNSISEMELSEEVNLASFKSPKIIDSNFKSKFFKKPK